MQLELARHLDKARDTVAEVDRIVSLHQYPSDTRTVVVRGLLGTIMEHHRSILQLLKSGAVDSSYALARDVVKGMRYGLWVNSAATEEQLLQVQQSDAFPLSIAEMVEGIEAAYGRDSFFESLKNRWATQLYKYTRSDVVRVGRWHIDASAGLRSNENEIREVVTISTLCIVTLAAKFLDRQKLSADCAKVEALAADYGT
ncbi:MAG TPA: hypothetical protein VMU53_15285 [Candidatus Sulfotelmatobacter sp.]|nr:hypothetical protein [Candidatus Sulfotelmatobacter sp.]